ncbi:MAG: RNA polymerase sigma factor [Candidatus Aminicenantes bacterium]|nr:RNA polymerase sigma factor [Candidatus Aminicenantes bacterium]
MKDVYERFFIFTQSSFGKKEKDELYRYIWKNYRKKVSFYISNLVHYNHPYFEDLVQEVMIKIHKNLHTFNPLYSFKAWLYKIARNHTLDFLKNKNNRIHSSNGLELVDDEASNNPEEILIEDNTRAKIDQIINSMESIDREIAYLKFYEEIRYKDISRILKLNTNTVKSRVRLIKRKIREKLK